MAERTRACVSGWVVPRGRRTSSPQWPSSLAANYTGAGFDSMKSAW